MLLNEQESTGLCLKKSVVADYTAQVINIFNGIADPIRRYGVARVMLNIFTDACKDAGAAAEAFCEKENIGWDGKDFVHEGCTYRRKFDINYNYAANATDIYGAPVSYAEDKAAVEMAEIDLKAKKAKLKADEIIIETAHPNMKPDVLGVSVQLRELMPE